MKAARLVLCGAIVVVLTLGSLPSARASQDKPKPTSTPDLSGLHDFDRRVGHWTGHNRRLKEPLTGKHEWQEFEMTQNFWQVMGGYANVDENVFNLQNSSYRGVTLRAYDPRTGQWAIW